MAYTKTTWVSGAAPGIDADELNNLETQYDEIQAILTTRGDIFYRNATALARLAKGVAGQILKQGVNYPEWGTSTIEAIVTTRGDILLRDAASLARLAKGSKGQVVTQGDNDPEWGEAVSSFTELASAEHNATAAHTWEDWDISAIVPVGIKSVEVVISGYANGNMVGGARKNGSALDRKYYIYYAEAAQLGRGSLTLTVEVDANRIIEIYTSTATLGFYIVGYWK